VLAPMRIISLVLLSLTLASALPAGAAQRCGELLQHRIVSGPSPQASSLYSAARKADAGSWASGFWEEHFNYLGTTQNVSGETFRIASLSTTWGSACRLTERLLVFSANNVYLGRYSHIPLREMKIRPPYELIFPYAAKEGNVVSFKLGLPSSIWIGGENYELEANNSFKPNPLRSSKAPSGSSGGSA
jgi:hypothetical protein